VAWALEQAEKEKVEQEKLEKREREAKRRAKKIKKGRGAEKGRQARRKGKKGGKGQKGSGGGGDADNDGDTADDPDGRAAVDARPHDPVTNPLNGSFEVIDVAPDEDGIDDIAWSPDGRWILYTVHTTSVKTSLRFALMCCCADVC
jgi:hypothetical protein